MPEVDVPGGPVGGTRDVQEDRCVEDVRADDLVRREREHDQQRQAEEHAAPDGRQPDDEAAEEPDEDGSDLVAGRQRPVRIASAPLGCTRLFAISPTAPNRAPRRAPGRCTDFASSP